MEPAAVRHHLAEFCAVLPQLRAAANRDGWSDDLRGIVTTIRGDPATAPGALRQLWRSLGIDVAGRGNDLLAGLTGQSPTPPPGGAYVCPKQACRRLDLRQPGDPVPSCELFEAVMVWQR